MTHSRHLAGLIGPAMVGLGVTEAINMDVFANQIAPVVYLNGAILFVAGLAIVRAHNLWAWRWPDIMTLTGWVALIGGRMMCLFDSPLASIVRRIHSILCRPRNTVPWRSVDPHNEGLPK